MDELVKEIEQHLYTVEESQGAKAYIDGLRRAIRIIQAHSTEPQLPPTAAHDELEQQIDDIMEGLVASHNFEYAGKALKALVKATERAYGGCHGCFGKGYSTVNDRWLGTDTDQDIGSPGGTVSGGDPFAMKFCTCERGEQLRRLTHAYRKENHD